MVVFKLPARTTGITADAAAGVAAGVTAGVSLVTSRG